MAKFKFKDFVTTSRAALVDRDGDSLGVTTFRDKTDGPFTAILIINGASVGLKRKQALTLGKALIEAAEAR